MSNIEKHIDRWRKGLAQSDAFTGGDIGELENHLREEIATLQRKGLSEQEAVLVARHRLGDTSQLAEEFAKVDGGRRAMQHLSSMAMGVLLFLLASYTSTGISRGGVWVGTLFGLNGYALGWVGAALKVLTVVGLLLFGWLILRSWTRTQMAEVSKGMSIPQAILWFFVVVMLAVATIGGQLLFTAATARSLGVAEYGRACLVMGYAGFAWTILTPILAAVVFVTARVHVQRHRRVCDTV